ncbi:protein FAM83G-like isoform X2 [Sinocyclocheilus anshuiensis]|uniref:protein FAM83G-like isoform X2 n=1 Tax=Sinocyclocheilus anshuiensis TaxID=1608454 RepID=UPI0007B7C044|nr:PREDICTED: protein FAM83G-like isoform X2 [Sinocyclocheilus anshuiensis]
MALSQVQCLDNNHVNWRLNESKPEFFYSENQRLALEALITKGRDAFDAYMKEHELRPFLSEPELERLRRSIEEYKPGSEHQKPDGTTEGEDGAVSLQYWPDRSDISIPNLDLGWPDCNSYRGVTRVNVYTQPPVDGQTHIKEVVRKAIAQAQKMIAVVMDVFTDVDIFKDLIEAGFKKKVAIYIIIDYAALQHFLLMCERANMHKGHLNHLRVRCIGGSEFYTHSAQKVHGSLSQKFMFVDGDRAVSGSYSFTWTASRLDRNIITVLTGQAVETFDKQFRELYLNSRGVNLTKIPLADPPEPDPVPIAVPSPVPVTVARKLMNPKYALVNVDAASKASSDKASAKNSNSKNPMVQIPKPQRETREGPQKHPGLVGLLKADLIPYLPTWPEPDPPSDVIGFINIRDTSKPAQVHLMRSQMFETSQAIRFKDPFTAPPEEPLPDKASPRPKTKELSKTAAVDANVQSITQPQAETNSSNAHQDIPANTSHSPSPPIQQQDPKPSPPPQEQESNPEPAEVQQASEMPVPKPRTLQLVVNRPEGSEDPEVTLVRREENQTKDANMDTRDNDADSTAVTCAHSLKDKDENSTTSDEYYECTDSDSSDKLPNGRLTGSGRVGDHSPDALNMMARFSQSMLDLRSDDFKQNTAEKNLLNKQNRDKTKMVSRSPVRDAYGRAKVVIGKHGVFYRLPKSSGHVIGGHRYWQGKMNADFPSNGSGQQNLKRSGRSPRRQSSTYTIVGLRISQTPTQRLMHSQSLSPAHRASQTKSPSPHRRVETRTPLGISLSKLTSVKHLRGKVPVSTSGFALGDKLLTQRHNEN